MRDQCFRTDRPLRNSATITWPWPLGVVPWALLVGVTPTGRGATRTPRRADGLRPGTRVTMKILIIDDFLANGAAVSGLIDIINQAGAELEGVGIAIEKGFQPGRKVLEEKGARVESLAIIEKMGNGTITFKEQDD